MNTQPLEDVILVSIAAFLAYQVVTLEAIDDRDHDRPRPTAIRADRRAVVRLEEWR